MEVIPFARAQASTTEREQARLLLRERVFVSTADLLCRLGSSNSVLGLIQSAEGQLAGLVARFGDGPVRAQDITNLRAALDRAEFGLLTLHAGIPTDRISAVVHDDSTDGATLECYASFLALYAGVRPECRDRLDFVVTHLLTKENLGERELIPFDNAVSLLNRICGFGDAVRDEIRTEAERYFTDITLQIQAQDSIGALLDSGLYLDLYGYKHALGDQFADPEILYASAGLNVALGNHLLRLSQGPDSDVCNIDERMERARAEVRVLFKPDPLPADTPSGYAPVPSQRTLTKAASEPEAWTPPVPPRVTTPGRARLQPLLLVALVAILGYGAWTVSVIRSSGNSQALDAKEVTIRFPLLHHASVTTGGHGAHLMGALKSEAWPPKISAQKQTARHLIDELSERGIRSATISDSRGNLVLEIRAAQVVYPSALAN